MALLTDAEVQLKLATAERFLWDLMERERIGESPKLWLAYSLILNVRSYSKSGNGIPGLRGLGLEEAVSLAESIIENPPRSERDIAIQSYKPIGSAIALSSK